MEVFGMYNKVDNNLNFVEREKKIEQFWKDNEIFQKSIDIRQDGENYTFYDGPPTANGKPSNAAEIFAKEDVDGGLIGGAALVAGDFLAIGKGF